MTIPIRENMMKHNFTDIWKVRNGYFDSTIKSFETKWASSAMATSKHNINIKNKVIIEGGSIREQGLWAHGVNQ